MSVIDDYLTKLDKPQRLELDRIRKIVKQLLPDTEETISYGIPTLQYKNKNLIHFAAYKNHMSLYPGPKAIELLGNKLNKFKLSKGTIQFTVDCPIPNTLIIEIVKIRLDEINN